MFRLPVLFAVIALAGSCTSPESTSTDADPSAATEPANQLVHVQGHFVAIKPTGKRHGSFIFSFRVQDEFRGPGQAPKARDELVRFELYQDFGGRDLLLKLSGAHASARVDLQEVVRTLGASPPFQLVLWLVPPQDVFGGGEVNAELVQSPLAVRPCSGLTIAPV